MTIGTDVERLGYGGPAGSFAEGLRQPVIQSVGATRTLLAKESGSLCLFDRAAGNVFTLPAPTEGLWFDFLQTVAVTTNASKVITNAATVFLIGGITIGSLTLSEATDTFLANGTTHVAISEDGATKGGLQSGVFRVVCISTTQWAISGLTVGAGTLADPFATS